MFFEMKCIFSQFLSATTVPSVARVSAPSTTPSWRGGANHVTVTSHQCYMEYLEHTAGNGGTSLNWFRETDSSTFQRLIPA